MVMERRGELAVLAVVTLLTLLLLYQYLSVVLGAILLAYLLGPAHRWLSPRFGEKPVAIGLIIGTTVVVVVPLILLLGVVVSGLGDLVEAVVGEEGEANLATLNELLEQVYGADLDVQTSIAQFVRDGQFGDVLTALLSTIGGVSAAFVTLTILIVLSYYLLLEGDRLVEWIESQLPLAPEDRAELIERADKLMYAVVIGNVVVGVVDGTLVGIGLLLTGFSSVLFWTVIAIFTALIPLVGSMLVWVPAAGYLVLTGSQIAGVALAVYGFVVIGTIDNLLRPYVGARQAGLDPALFIVGIFSGLSLLGIMGLFYGPIVLVMGKHTYDVIGPNAD